MARTDRADTIAGDIQQQVRELILGGSLLPGAPLRPGALRLQFGVSVSVVREALCRLAEQRLVHSAQNQGFRVAPLSVADLREVTALRVHLDAHALAAAVAAADAGWQSRVLSAHHLLSRSGGEAAHRAFHRELVAGGQMPLLLGVSDSLADLDELYRRHTTGRAGRDVAAEHAALTTAAIGGDPAAATTALTSHLQRTCDDAVAALGG